MSVERGRSKKVRDRLVSSLSLSLSLPFSHLRDSSRYPSIDHRGPRAPRRAGDGSCCCRFDRAEKRRRPPLLRRRRRWPTSSKRRAGRRTTKKNVTSDPCSSLPFHYLFFFFPGIEGNSIGPLAPSRASSKLLRLSHCRLQSEKKRREKERGSLQRN